MNEYHMEPLVIPPTTRRVVTFRDGTKARVSRQIARLTWDSHPRYREGHRSSLVTYKMSGNWMQSIAKCVYSKQAKDGTWWLVES